MQVDPAELRAAGRQIGTSHTGAGAASATVAGIRDAASGLTGTATAGALPGAATAAESAIEVVRSRVSSWVSVLNESADTYEGSDDRSAQRLAALGDFNRTPAH